MSMPQNPHPSASGKPLYKPHWLSREDFDKFMETLDGAPRCVRCGTVENLSFDHIVSRLDRGTDDVSNLQILCVPHNSKKGPRPDDYWSRSFYWDQRIDLSKLRMAQRQLFESITREPLTSRYMALPASNISQRIYLLGWVVGAGKTLGIPTAAFAMNHLLRREWGSPRRADRILVLAKESAVRDQLARDLAKDLVGYGVVPYPPRVATVKNGTVWDSTAWLDGHDVVVACLQQLYERNGEQRGGLAGVLAHFPLIFVDEPHFASVQVRSIVKAAHQSVVFGLTGSPIDGAGKLLDDFVLFDLFTYQDAVHYDKSLKYLHPAEEERHLFVREVGVSSADLMRSGTVQRTGDTDYEVWQLEPGQNLVEEVLRYMKSCDAEEPTLVGSTMGAPADHRDPDEVITDLWYPIHALIVCESIKIAQRLCEATNRHFDTNRSRYPARCGWQAEVVHAETVDADGTVQVAPLDPDKHPWLRAKNLSRDPETGSYRVDEKCARVLFVIGMAREGINNPLCGVVGVASEVSSIVEYVQRTLGRQLRAVIYVDEEGNPHVPPRRMDTVLVVVHPTNKGARISLARSIEFVTNMESEFDDLPTIADLVEPVGGGASKVDGDEPSNLSLDKKLAIVDGIVATMGPGWRAIAGTQDGRKAAATVVQTVCGGLETRTAQNGMKWVDLLHENPERAWQRLHHVDHLGEISIVVRETERHDIDDEELAHWVRQHQPDLAHHLVSSVEAASIFRAWYQQWASEFALPAVPMDTNLDVIRKNLAGAVLTGLRGYFVGDFKEIQRSVHSLVGTAVKTVLGVPESESANVGSRFDTPQCHVVLTRHDTSRDITGWVRAKMIRKGYCPRLFEMFAADVDG